MIPKEMDQRQKTTGHTRLTVNELTRLAFVWAEQDRSSLADAWPEGSEERAYTENQRKQLHDYRMKRWGPKTNIDEIIP